MEALLFRLVRGAARQARESTLTSIAEEWSAHWFPTASSVQVTVANEVVAPAPEQAWLVIGQAPDHWLAWRLDPESARAMVAAMVNHGLGASSKLTPLVAGLSHELVHDFFARLRQQFPEAKLLDAVLGAESYAALRTVYGSGAVQVELKGVFPNQQLVLGGGIVELCQPQQGSAVKPAALQAREQSLDIYPARIEVTAGHAEMTLQDLADMEVGDVILLQSKVADSFQVKSSDGKKTLAKVHLGLLGEHKAIQFIE